jgi:hypothetical protein
VTVVPQSMASQAVCPRLVQSVPAHSDGGLKLVPNILFVSS